MTFKTLLGALLALAIAAPALAAGSTSSSTRPTPPSAYKSAVKAVKSKDYRSALRLLDQVVRDDPRNADAWNYLGFSNRKLGHFDAAFVNYRKALDIDPDHRGAHEYLGELYVQKGDLAAARKHLAALDRICLFGCEEYRDLKKAVKAFAASGAKPGVAPAPAATDGRPPICNDVGGYEAYMKRTGKVCRVN